MLKDADLSGNDLRVIQHQTSGWNAATIAAKINKKAGLEIISEMELDREYCDSEDWDKLKKIFGSEIKLINQIEKV